MLLFFILFFNIYMKQEYRALGKRSHIFFWKVFSEVSGCVSLCQTTETFWSFFPQLCEGKNKSLRVLQVF